MSLNVTELKKIRKATSTSEKSKNFIANYIHKFKKELEDINNLESERIRKELIQLMNEKSSERKNALTSGVSSYSDPRWAAPAACESYLHCVLGGKEQEIKEANVIITDLTDLDRKIESGNSNILGYLILLIGSPISFYFFNWWIGLIVAFLGLVIIGWKKRYD